MGRSDLRCGWSVVEKGEEGAAVDFWEAALACCLWEEGRGKGVSAALDDCQIRELEIPALSRFDLYLVENSCPNGHQIYASIYPIRIQ